jgi:hypothetical protein
MPAWRRSARAAIAPHRRKVSLLTVVLMALAVLNSLFDWGFLNLHGRKSEGVALIIGLVWFVFVSPTRRERLESGR